VCSSDLISYVRLYNDEGVYAISGYIAMLVNHPFNQWRDKSVLKSDKSKLTKISFFYPADTGFIMEKESNKWKIASEYADSAKVEQFLSAMTMINSLGFVDGFVPAGAPVITLTLEGNSMNPITVKAFPADTVKRFVIQSSYNPTVFFSGREYGLDERLLKGKSYFLSSGQPKKKNPGRGK
jgi:hypothetical protein